MADIYKIIMKQLATRPRIIGLAVMAVVTIGLALLVGQADGATDADAVRFINTLGLTLLTPVVTLLFASAALGDLYENGSLVYLWLRPVARWKIVIAALAAVITICVPVLAITFAIAGLLASSASVALGAAVATVFVVPAYGAIFVALGLFSTRALIWGLGYILLFEGFIAAIGSVPGKLSLVTYSRSLLGKVADVTTEFTQSSLPISLIVLVGVAAAGTAIGSWRLSNMNIP